jgi:hypothetical protein
MYERSLKTKSICNSFTEVTMHHMGTIQTIDKLCIGVHKSYILHCFVLENLRNSTIYRKFKILITHATPLNALNLR